MKQIIKYIIIFILIIIVLPNLCTKKRKKENETNWKSRSATRSIFISFKIRRRLENKILPKSKNML